MADRMIEVPLGTLAVLLYADGMEVNDARIELTKLVRAASTEPEPEPEPTGPEQTAMVRCSEPGCPTHATAKVVNGLLWLSELEGWEFTAETGWVCPGHGGSS